MPIPILSILEQITAAISLTQRTLNPEDYGAWINSKYDVNGTNSTKRGDNVPPTDTADKMNDSVYTDVDDMINFSIKDVVNNNRIRFRCTVTDINHSSNPTWDSHDYVGRPYSVYYYKGTSRSTTLNFKVYANTSSELNIVWKRLNYLEGLTHPAAYRGSGGEKGGYVVPPYIEFTLGNLYKNQLAFISSLNFSIDTNSIWDIKRKLPNFIHVSIGFTIIEDKLRTPHDSFFGFYSDTVDNINPIDPINPSPNVNIPTNEELRRSADDFGV